MKAIALALLLAAALLLAFGCAAVADSGKKGIPPMNTTLPAGEGGDDTPPLPPGV